MPLVFNETFSETQLALWQITETVDELLELYSPNQHEVQAFTSITNETRKKEWLAIRALLVQIGIEKPEIAYIESGKPQLTNTNRSFSITHSTHMCGILLSNSTHCGIDLERQDRSVERVLSRFLSETEKKTFSIDWGLRLWCAKEAVFKAANQANVDFAQQIQLIPSEVGENNIQGTFKNQTHQFSFRVNFIEIKEHIVAWTEF
jgi:4'-phosphopantetheinyl transferase